jgi:hypothetical protein
MSIAFAAPPGLQSLRLARKVHSLVRVQDGRLTSARPTRGSEAGPFALGLQHRRSGRIPKALFPASEPVWAVLRHSTEARAIGPNIQQPLSR